MGSAGGVEETVGSRCQLRLRLLTHLLCGLLPHRQP